VTVNPVFVNRRSASLYCHTASLYRICYGNNVISLTCLDAVGKNRGKTLKKTQFSLRKKEKTVKKRKLFLTGHWNPKSQQIMQLDPYNLDGTDLFDFSYIVHERKVQSDQALKADS
jgi:hypothetical protein